MEPAHRPLQPIALPWEDTLATAQQWEDAGEFMPIHPDLAGNYPLGEASCAILDADALRICNRVWWSDAEQCFMVTENVQSTFPAPPNHDMEHYATTSQLLRHRYPCRQWSLPTPASSIFLGVDTTAAPAAANLHYGHRMAFIDAQHGVDSWHPPLFHTCLRACQSGLRAYVATHNPEPWINLRNYVGRKNLTFIEEAAEDPRPRLLLYWDYTTPPSADAVTRYSQAGTLIWTRMAHRAQCTTFFPNYLIECLWPSTPQHHVERYAGVFHSRGQHRQLRCLADRANSLTPIMDI